MAVTYYQLRALIIRDYENNKFRSLDNLLKSRLPHLDSAFGTSRATAITPAALEKYVNARLGEGAANATVNRELAALSRMFRLAVNQRLLGPNSLLRVKLLKERNARKGFFERDQFEALLRYLPEALRPVMTTAYITGWRIKSELLTRHWCHVDLDAGWLRLEPNETKNGQGRQFPLTAELRACLSAQRRATTECERLTGQEVPWVFHRDGRPIRRYQGAWESARRAAGLVDRIPHDFRRTAVRNLERAGVPQSTAMAMVGHLTATVYRRYAIVDEKSLRAAADRIDSFGHSSGNVYDGASKEHGQKTDIFGESGKTSVRKISTRPIVFAAFDVASVADVSDNLTEA